VISNKSENLIKFKSDLYEFSKEIGFDDLKITKAEIPSNVVNNFDHFIKGEFYGDMVWLKEKSSVRRDPQVLWEDVKTVISLAVNYTPKSNPLDFIDYKNLGIISVYARGEDYHKAIKKRLKRLAQWIVKNSNSEVKVFVDTAPVLEKPLAQQAGLGWQGKHTNLVSREFGSWIFLAEIFSTIDFPVDLPETNHCGTCNKCIEICPTNAFMGPNRLDPRRCISYLTIEHKGHIPVNLRHLIGNRIYGCDDCLAVCPWNKFATLSNRKFILMRPDLEKLLLKDLVRLDHQQFRSFFSGTPVKRIGRDRFVRNVLIAIANSSIKELTPVIEILLSDNSPLVRAMSIWALSKLSPERFINLKKNFFKLESDHYVLEEWSRL